MQAPGIPENEEQRLKSLYITGLLDTRDDERFERLTRLAWLARSSVCRRPRSMRPM